LATIDFAEQSEAKSIQVNDSALPPLFSPSTPLHFPCNNEELRERLRKVASL